MPSSEGASERQTGEIVETDLSRTEGLPSERGQTVNAGGIARPRTAAEEPGAETEISAFFRGPFNVDIGGSLRNRSTDSSPMNRSVAALLPVVLGTLVATLFGWIFLDSAVPDEIVFGGSLLIVIASFILGGYLANRVDPGTRAPEPDRPDDGPNATGE